MPMKFQIPNFHLLIFYKERFKIICSWHQQITRNYKLIDSLKQKNSSGHDNITSSLIKDIKHEIAIPLTILFNKSIHSGRVPDDIKLAKVIPIYKAKDKELLNNYRPISLPPTTSKILEKIVHKRLYYFVVSQSVFYNSQYSFRPKHSTIHAVKEFVDDTTTSFEDKQHILWAYFWTSPRPLTELIITFYSKN